MKKAVLFCLLLCVDSGLFVGKLNKLPDGKYAITGRGCGTLTPIRYLKKIPDNLDDHHCSIISEDEFEKSANSGDTSEEENINYDCIEENLVIEHEDGNLDIVYDLEDAAACLDECKKFNLCFSFTFRSECHLKLTVETKVTREGRFSAIMSECGVKRCGRTVIARFIRDDPIQEQTTVANSQECFDLCKNTAGCIAFVFQYLSAGRLCWIFDSTTTVTDNYYGVLAFYMEDCL